MTAHPEPRSWARPILAAYCVAMAVLTHVPPIEIIVPAFALSPAGADKLIHFGLYVFLTLLLLRARLAGATRPQGNLLAATGIAFLWAVVDELTQGITGRTSEAGDVVANLVGVLSVLAVASRQMALSHQVDWRAWARASLVILVPAMVIGALWPSLRGCCLSFHFGFLEVGFDKIWRFLGAMLLTWLLPAAQPFGASRKRLNVAGSITLVAIIAFFLELAQTPIGRGKEIADLTAHGFGMGVALAMWGGQRLASWGHGDRAEPVESRNGHTAFVGHAVLVSLLTLVSRLTGLLRDAVLAAALGLGAVSDAFFMAFLIPNLFRRLFGEGALGISFIPTYSQLVDRDPALARRVASVCIGLLTVFLAVLTVVGEILLAVMYGMEGWAEDSRLALRLVMIMLPYMPLICLVALIGAVLQVHRLFGPPASAPILLNLAVIGCTMFAFHGVRGDLAARHHVSIIGYCVLIGGLVQLIWQLPSLRRVQPFSFQFHGTRPALQNILSMMLPMIVGLAVFQINALLDSLIAFGLSPKDGDAQPWSLLGYSLRYPIREGSLAALQLAQRLYQFPLGVFGIAIATALFPVLSRTAADLADSHREMFASVLRRGLRLTVFIGLPASVGLILVRLPLIRLIYQRGEFRPEDAHRVASILVGYGSAVWAYSLTHVVTRAFYALRDTRTPLVIAVSMVGLNLALNLTLIWPLGAAGLAWSTAISGLVQVILLMRAIRIHVPGPVGAEVRISWGLTALLSLTMAVILLPIMLLYDPSLSDMESAVLLGVLVLVGIAVFVGGSWVIKAQELRWLWRRAI